MMLSLLFPKQCIDKIIDINTKIINCSKSTLGIVTTTAFPASIFSREFNDLLIKKALQLNGTITGEHGVGLHKKEYLLEEHGDNIPVMKMIKRSIDQNNIMNPGKIFDLN